MGSKLEQLDNVPRLKVHARKRDMIRIVKNKILPVLTDMNKQLDILFERPVLFHPKYLNPIDKQKLQILVLAIGWNTDVNLLLESERRRLFKRVLLELQLRIWTWEEIKMLIAALGFKGKKRSKLKNDVQFEVSRLVRRIKKKLLQI